MCNFTCLNLELTLVVSGDCNRKPVFMNAQVPFNSCNFCVGLDVSVKLEALYSNSGTVLNQFKIVICIWWGAFLM